MSLIFIIFVLLVTYAENTSGSSFSSNCPYAPENCPNNEIKFWLYTRQYFKNPYQLNLENDSVKNAPFVPNKQFILILHGINGSREMTPNKQLIPELLQRDNYNLIVPNYERLVKVSCYMAAVFSIENIANCTAQFIDYLISNNKTSHPQLHIISYSLGAHIAGLISQFIKTGKLEHITGLDPAGPMFETNLFAKMLDKNAANFVDILHTTIMKGKIFSLGHVNFYANKALYQPGCPWFNLLKYIKCMHKRAVIYYAESINTEINKGFWGTNCYFAPMCFREKSEQIFGFHVPKSARGMYYFKTNNKPPYAQGHNW